MGGDFWNKWQGWFTWNRNFWQVILGTQQVCWSLDTLWKQDRLTETDIEKRPQRLVKGSHPAARQRHSAHKQSERSVWPSICLWYFAATTVRVLTQIFPIIICLITSNEMYPRCCSRKTKLVLQKSKSG